MDRLLKYFDGDELAADVWLSKYAYSREETPDDMHWRMAKEFAKIEVKYVSDEREIEDLESLRNLSEYGQQRMLLDEIEYPYETLQYKLENDIYKLFKDFKYIIPQGSIMSQLGTHTIGSLSNCSVIGEGLDSYGGILKVDQEQIQLMKRRGGVGHDISHIRPNGNPVKNSALTSTGIVPFMERYSNSTREVAMKGRRGALMLSMDIRHPDIIEFIKIKRDLSKVTGANISIKLNDKFMRAVENDGDYILRFPCDVFIPKDLTSSFKNIIYHDCGVENLKYNKLHTIRNTFTADDKPIYVKKIKAKELWYEIIKSAHSVAEPGILMWDNIINYSPDSVYVMYRPTSTNPCGEVPLQPYDTCRLLAVNLFSFVDDKFTDKAKFNYNKFYKINYEAMRLSDNLVDLEIIHIKRIIKKIKSDKEPKNVKHVELSLWKKIKKTAKSSRRTGLGFTGLGDTLAALSLDYGSPKSIIEVEKIMKTKLRSELDCTIDLAILRGTFKGWDNNLEK
jgi:ribonucleoside-diphosphate reductase alpha chain